MNSPRTPDFRPVTGKPMTAKAIKLLLVLTACAIFGPALSLAAGLGQSQFQWPSAQELFSVLTFKDYNTRVVIAGTTLLGLAAGWIGTFLLLRKRALLSDAISHATLPGIALAFILMSIVLGDGKHLIGLMIGAIVFSVIGTASVLFIQNRTRLKDDAALGIVLSVYFGLGIALMGVATRMASGNAAGLSSFIYGKTASMLLFDALLIAGTALAAILFCLLFFKEFALVCFDADYGATQGWPIARLDFFMMTIVVLVTVIGLQAVGLILVVALLIIPAASARFWTLKLRAMFWLAGFFGALAGLLGSGFSAVMANLPAGAVIVLTASFIFIVSMVFGSARGVVKIMRQRVLLRRRIAYENLLRDLYEWFDCDETCAGQMAGPRMADLMARRFWSRTQLTRNLRRLKRDKNVIADQSGRLVLTDQGRVAAAEVVRKHRLWEAYLIAHADVAAGMVDLSADRIEHVLDEEIIAQLERLFPELEKQKPPPQPPCPESGSRSVHDVGMDLSGYLDRGGGRLSAMSCALLGNYLVLRRMSMMGDAISHAVLPGLAIAFLVSGSRESLPMLFGAIIIGILTTLFIQGIDRLSGLDRGASMGVVFTTLFALGLILIRQAADHVDLDPGCVLYGAIELTPLDTYDLAGHGDSQSRRDQRRHAFDQPDFRSHVLQGAENHLV
jgi:manganese/zinc/iron transport system permease protein